MDLVKENFPCLFMVLKVPNEEIKPYQNTWKIGVRPAYPAETIHYANTLADGESWRLPKRSIKSI